LAIKPSQWAEFVLRHNLYAIDVDQGRNCYSYRGFGHLARNYKNKGIVGQGRRIDYDEQINLSREESLIVFN